ncbi:alpha/beta fold hydrolase [Streptomyces sp. NPDC058595]|uniref:alpha/beta fold hydrolase n=1 Tax=Streptomyces sp. NPDC058595 TaxID=3346550 RepID=UPI00364EA175
MVIEQDVKTSDGRTLRTYDSGGGETDGLTVVWHHGSPQTGVPLEPLLTAAAARGIRLVSYGRPSYGGSSPLPGRNVASAAADVERIADALGVGSFATMGASGGGPHALACAALLPDRVTGAVCLAGIAPYTRDFDWYEGMASPGGLRSAADGREARELYAATDEFDPASFTSEDFAALAGTWSSLGEDAGKAGQAGPDGLIDDDVAFATAWGFDLAEVAPPVLLVQGSRDRVVPPAHATSMLAGLPRAELWVRPGDGHVSVLDACPVAMDWLLARR